MIVRVTIVDAEGVPATDIEGDYDVVSTGFNFLNGGRADARQTVSLRRDIDWDDDES